MTSKLTKEWLQHQISAIQAVGITDSNTLAAFKLALAAMDSESVELPLDYLQGHKDGLEWAARLAEANHPDTGDWLYDDPIELAKAIRKGPDMPPAQPAPVVPDEIKHRIGGLDWGWEGEFNRGWNACRAAMLQAGNSPQSMKCKTADELLACVPRNTGRSREHFISLCNEFWNWSEMDLVCADEKGYEPTMEWNGTKFTHRVTQALWRMYQAAPVNSPVIPDGYVMVPKDLLSELRDWAHPEIEKYCEMWEGRRDSEFPALRKVIADADALLAAAPQEVKGE